MGLECISVVIWRCRLRWFGHVKRMGAGNWVKSARSMKVEGVSARGKPKKTWNEVIHKDLRDMGLTLSLLWCQTFWCKS